MRFRFSLLQIAHGADEMAMMEGGHLAATGLVLLRMGAHSHQGLFSSSSKAGDEGARALLVQPGHAMGARDEVESDSGGDRAGSG